MHFFFFLKGNQMLCYVDYLSNLYAENKNSIHMAVDEIIEDVVSLELNDLSMSEQSSHNPN